MVDLVVAGSAQGHEIFSGMSAALRDWNLVMNLCCRNNSSDLLTLLTKRMLSDVAVTNPFPGTAILLVDIWGALILVILPPSDSSVIVAVLPIRQLGTTRVRTGALGFSWHDYPPSVRTAGSYSG